VAKLTPDLGLVYLTRIGGSDLDQGRGVAADGSGSLYLTGVAVSPDFPTKDPFTTPLRALSFVMKLKADTSEVVWSTLIGGNTGAEAATIAVDGSENVYVEGRTSSTTGLIGPGGLQPSFGGGSHDIFLIQIKQEVRARIDVLPSTTRWKPQRSDDPIVVEFEGPKELKSTTTLEIKDPADAVLPGQSVAFAIVDGTIEPAKYRLTWSGPWSREVSGKLERLPAGNYSFVVKGITKDDMPLDSDPSKPCKGTTAPPAAAPPPSCSVASLVEVTALKLMAPKGARPLEANTGAGGGDAIFAEARAPNGSVEDVVQVVATIDPAIRDPRTQGSVQIFFQAYDVDDPSSDKQDIDNEGNAIDNRADDAAGFGIIEVNPATQKPVFIRRVGVGASYALEAGDTSEIVALLRVSPRQGDNYRVAASTRQDWVSGLRAEQRTPQLDANGKPLPAGWLDGSDGRPLNSAIQRVQLTDMLTVWRTLHLELDRYGLDPAGGRDSTVTGSDGRLDILAARQDAR
jgi:hypothetical protein